MKTFENPSNGYRESVDGYSILWALLFGWVYYAVRGLWAHMFIQVVIVVVLALMTGGPGALIAFPMWLIYAFMTPSIIEGRYQKMGWREVNPDYPSSADRQVTPPAPPPAPVQSTRERKCPFCAEQIKAEAIICRFCQRDVQPVAAAAVAAVAAAAAEDLPPDLCVAKLTNLGCRVSTLREGVWEVLQPSGTTAYARSTEALQALTARFVRESGK